MHVDGLVEQLLCAAVIAAVQRKLAENQQRAALLDDFAPSDGDLSGLLCAGPGDVVRAHLERRKRLQEQRD